MRVLIFHGYLLRGTGSNVYNASLAQALARQGHEVHLLCQDRHAAELDWVDAIGSWGGGRLEVERVRDAGHPGSVTVYRPEIGGLLPVYVLDRYEGFEVKTFPELSDAELDGYLDANVAAVSDVVGAVGDPDAALANHLIMGPAILARAGPALRDQGPRLGHLLHGPPAPRPLRSLRARGDRRRRRDPRRLLPHGKGAVRGRPGSEPAGAHPARAAGRRRPPLPPASGGRGPPRPARGWRTKLATERPATGDAGRLVRPRRPGDRRGPAGLGRGGRAGAVRRQAPGQQGGRPAGGGLAAHPSRAHGRGVHRATDPVHRLRGVRGGPAKR